MHVVFKELLTFCLLNLFFFPSVNGELKDHVTKDKWSLWYKQHLQMVQSCPSFFVPFL